MKTILRIARVELSSLFYSPIAWFLLILFLIQCALVYTGKLESQVNGQELGRDIQNLTFDIFANPQQRGLFIIDVLKNLYLYIPLITMGLISRETHSGTIKLLFSSPVKLSSIVLGKYGAMLVFNLCMILMLGIIVTFAFFQIESLDLGMIFSGLFGIYLLLSAYAAIGLFMSCLSTYQVVAAIATFSILALLNFVGTLWQDVDFVRDLTDYLSISGRTESMIMGLMTTRDVLYYLLITAMFLSFAWLKLQGQRKSSTLLQSISKNSLVLLLVLVIGHFTSKPGYIGYWDTTRTQMNTLSVGAQQTLKEIGDEPLEVTTYVNLLDQTYIFSTPKSINAGKKRWERYLRFKPNIKLDYVYYYDSVRTRDLHSNNPGMNLDEIAQKYAKSYKINLDRFKKPEEIRKIIDLYPEKNRVVMHLKLNGKETFLRTFNDTQFWPSETETAAALKRLTVDLPRIAFLQGEGERSIDKMGDRHYKLITSEINVRAALINQGFDPESLTLKGGESIPEGITALVIADPRSEFEPEVLDKIQQYIDEGGNLLLAGEPGKQSVLKPILDRLGVQMMDGILVQEDKNFSPDEVKSLITSLGASFGRYVTRLMNLKEKISTRGVAGLTYSNDSDFLIQPLLVTDAEVSWNKVGKLVLDSTDIVYNPEAGDEKKSHPTALALTRDVNGKEQRILVTGDADFLSNIEQGRSYPKTGNAEFYQGFLGWFSYGQFPIEPTWPDPIDNSFHLTGDGVSVVKWIMLGLIPGLLLLMGSVLLIRRKRK
ncbi:Gldg family protein [Sphingobacterium faecale]|uniref:Gldg family protein n=1 Tax=Sphingobacterium faecale TaxID=2803775 RepID=A0ABS1R0L8_9SPHI|nr:Gldg family protein [Sphingobacterium faecale]MBL1408244.1 Gldg family protein [Sphingobacterium faecale]